MSDTVNTRRGYRSALRRNQAEQTQLDVLKAAENLFMQHGWARTTIAAIAREAGVSNETIYAVFGNKRALLERLVQNAIRGAEPQVPLLEQAGVQAIVATSSQAKQIRVFARSIASILNRVAPLIATARSAAESDPRLADLYRSLHEGRRRNLEFVALALVQNGPLREGLDQQTATDTIFRLASPELFLLFTRIEGRSVDDFANWLEECLTALLLPQRSWMRNDQI